MCGIVGYVGRADAMGTLLDALGKLEYRGYDSAGVAVLNGRAMHVCKRTGKLKVLADTLRQHPLAGAVGIGHTRWAPHGEPSEANALMSRWPPTAAAVVIVVATQSLRQTTSRFALVLRAVSTSKAYARRSEVLVAKPIPAL